MSLPRYSALTGAGLALTAVQVLLMPRWLSARQFGLVVLSISGTQAVLQLGDLGLVRLCIDGTRSSEERRQLRDQGRSLTVLSTAGVLLGTAALWLVVRAPERQVLAVIALGALAAQMVAADKFRAARAEVGGDEVGAASLNFLWTNAPKVGLVAGVLLFRSAPAIAGVAVVIAWTLSSPARPSFRPGLHALREVALWGVPFTAIMASFVLMWADTYFLSAHLGVDRAGAYEALYRIMGACTYGFLPLVSVITSRVSVAEDRPLARPLLLALAASAVGLAGSIAFVMGLGPSFFPNVRLPTDAIPALVAFYLLLPVSYCLGSALYVRARARDVTRVTAASAALALAGHAVFTLHGGPATAGAVTATAMAAAVVGQALVYRRSLAGPVGGGRKMTS